MQDITILSWNVQGLRHGRMSNTPFKKILPELERSPFDIICLQEMCDAKEKLATSSTLGSYHVFIPEVNAEKDAHTQDYNHNVVLSRYPIENVTELPFLGIKNIPFERVTRADIRIDDTVVRVYNCHLEMVGVGVSTRLAQLETILLDSKDWNGPTIVCGDMNAMTPKNRLYKRIIRWWNHIPDEETYFEGKATREDERILFTNHLHRHGFMDHLKLYAPTWSPLKTKFVQLFGLKLDWFMTKNLPVAEVALGDYISDHRAVIARIQRP